MNRKIKFRAWFKDIGMKYHYNPYESCDALMQFTGLLDKNGKEVFEGDVVGVEMFTRFKKYVVKFGFGSYDFGAYSFVGFYLEGLKDKDDFDGTANYMLNEKKIEVIGNIYEDFKTTNNG